MIDVGGSEHRLEQAHIKVFRPNKDIENKVS